MHKKIPRRQKTGEMHPEAKTIKVFIYLALLGITLATSITLQRKETLSFLTNAQSSTALNVKVSRDGVTYSERITINQGEGYYLKTDPAINGYLEARSPYPNDPRYPLGYRTFKWARSTFDAPSTTTNEILGVNGVFTVPGSMLANFRPGVYEGDFRPWTASGTNTAPWSNKVYVEIVTSGAGAGQTTDQADSSSYTLVGAGDIGDEDGDGDVRVANLIDTIVAANPDTRIFTAGDNVNETPVYLRDFTNIFEPTWGRHKAKIRPAPGNHDYTDNDTDNVASGYFQYFGTAAGEQGKGYYSYDIGSNWHIIALNSNCSKVGGCGETSAQGRWLRNDLETNKAKACKLVYWHHPYYSSGSHNPNTSGAKNDLGYFWNILYQYGADVVINGHNHNYERYDKQDPNGMRSDRGIRQFVVGTGGKDLRNFTRQSDPNEQARNGETHGVIKFTLNSNRYQWQFIPVEGETFTDSGDTVCNNLFGTTMTATNTPTPTVTTTQAASGITWPRENVKNVKNLIVPVDGDTQTSVNANLEWYSSPSDKKYSIYFEENVNPPTKVLVSESCVTGYNLPKLKENTVYYWQIETIEANGERVRGSVRTFTTEGKGTPLDLNAMVVVPDGEFMRGCDRKVDSKNNLCNYNDEWHIDTPLRSLWIDAFQLDKYEVTNQEYKACVAAGKCNLPGNRKYYDDPANDYDPVVFVSNFDAQAYCTWEGKRLPTEAEWEKAARGAVDTRLYPWGNERPTCDLANGSSLGCRPKKPHAAGGRYLGTSPYGARDMAGNVFEWVNDKYISRYYESAPAINPMGPPNSRYSVNQTFDDPNPIFIVRSGAWDLTHTHYLRVSHRHYGHHGLDGPFTDAPLYRSGVVGFRCAKTM